MSNDSKGYYKVLGLEPGASISEIKKAYNKKQLELHPSGPIRRKLRDSPEYLAMSPEMRQAKETELDEKIALVNQASTVLTDEKKKAEYDAGAGEFSAFPGGGFEGFEGFADIFSHMAGGRRSSGPSKVKDVTCEVKLTIKEAFLGKTSKFRVKTTKICEKCSGKGAMETCTCSKCHGKGVVRAVFNLGVISGTQQVECPDCDGKGSIAKGPSCSECRGKKVVEVSKILEVQIKPGIESGTAIVFTKQGNEYPGYVQGDVIFNVLVNETNKNYRIGDDYVTEADLDILTALTGGILYFDHPDGRKLAVKVEPFKDFDNVAIVVPNEGFPGRKGRGSIFIKPHILINSGLDRNKLSQQLKPMLSKPQGDYSNTNGILGKVPGLHENDQRHSRKDDFQHFGFDINNFSSFFT